MSQAFPRTMVGGVSLPRMLMGSNWILGYSHTSAASDAMINARNRNREAVAEIAGTFLAHGIDATMATMTDEVYLDGLKLAEDRAGKKIIRIATPWMNMDDNAAARKEAEATIKQSKDAGAVFCLPHHSCVEQLVNKNLQAIPRLPDYLKMIRDHGMIPGLSAHMPELILYPDKQGYDVETYVQIYNCMGFLMQIEIESVHNIIHNAKKPVMTIKPMAAGRCSPFVGITFSFATLRECDMVTVGCLTPKEAEEDIEIGLAAIERRRPGVAGRSSPKKTEIMK
ncbi:MAG: hypothetical protein FWF96_07275 [Kiritimatiellaeota bacterium]|nr:hypothetical protein [Kiritimatiellota bacterium]